MTDFEALTRRVEVLETLLASGPLREVLVQRCGHRALGMTAVQLEVTCKTCGHFLSTDVVADIWDFAVEHGIQHEAT